MHLKQRKKKLITHDIKVKMFKQKTKDKSNKKNNYYNSKKTKTNNNINMYNPRYN